MPTFKGLLEVIIQGPSVHWVRLEGCPCPGQTAGPVLVSAFMVNTIPSFPVPIPPLGLPCSFINNEDAGTVGTRW